MTLEYILSLSDNRATLETVGGKGASLVRLINADLPVPGGFHITTRAYQRFIAFNNLEHHIQETLVRIDVTEHSQVDEASQKIQDLIIQAEIPSDIASEIVQSYAELPGKNPAEDNLQSPRNSRRSFLTPSHVPDPQSPY